MRSITSTESSEPPDSEVGRTCVSRPLSLPFVEILPPLSVFLTWKTLRAQVYLLRSYQVDIGAHWQYLADKLRARIPGHRPLWTALSVPRLAFPAMSVELEVEAIKKE